MNAPLLPRLLGKTRINGSISISIWQNRNPEEKPYTVEIVTLKCSVDLRNIPMTNTYDNLVSAARDYVHIINILAETNTGGISDWYVYDSLANQQILSAIDEQSQIWTAVVGGGEQ